MSSPPPRKYRHLDDLVQEVETSLQQRQHASIKMWVEEGIQLQKGAQFQHDHKRLEPAYLDFLKAAQIVTHVIPGHKEFPTFKSSNNSTYIQYTSLQKSINEQWKQYESVNHEIKEDNRIHGTQRLSQQQNRQQSGKDPSQRPQMNGVAYETTQRHNDTKRQPPPVPSKPLSLPTQFSTDGKPNGPDSKLRAKNVTSNQPTTSDLHARFEKHRPSNARQGPQPVIPAATSSLIRGRPESPRVDTTGLPRHPSPTYSPARNSISPARSIPRKPMPTPTLTLTNETTLSPAALSSYMSRSVELKLLVLDVRERKEFEDGYIPARDIVCVEPLDLRTDVSGDQLEEKLGLLSSPRELELFSNRNTYDLVVYYDQSTSSDSFLTERTNDERLTVLKRLYHALGDFAYQKPLKRPPVLLAGGLTAWVEMFGSSSLKYGSLISSPPPPSKSAGVGLGISSFQKSTTSMHTTTDERLRGGPSRKKDEIHYAPLINIAEERDWLEKLQKDREPLTISVPRDAGNMDVKRQRRSTSIVSSSDSYPRTVEQFFQQWSPSVQQSMMTPIPGTPASAVFTPLTPGFPTKRNIIDHPFYGFTDVRNPEFHPPPSPVRPPAAVPRWGYKGEFEKPSPRPIEPPLPPKGSPKTGLTTFSGKTGNSNFGTTGLKNLGNTCYMNSILQCMNGTIPLSRYFMDGSYKQHINKENVLGSRGVLAEAFANVVRHLWDGQYKFISPMTFKEVSGRLNEMFKTSDQQDAQEFLEFLLDGLHEDLNPNASRTKLQDLTLEDERVRERLPDPYASFLEWQRYTHRNFSVVVNWFQGQLSSRLTCLTCNTRSTTYSPFMYLSLPVPPKKNPTILDCLEEFCTEETLEKEDAWQCPKCKKPRKATKKLTITRLPHMLIIHLKRFTNKGPWRDKLNTPIEYPLKELDLSKYVPQVGDGVPPGWTPPPEQTAPFLYDLYGVCNHYGTLNGGHYTAFVRNTYDEGWNLFDDSKASKVPEEVVMNKNAYVLFWVRSHIM